MLFTCLNLCASSKLIANVKIENVAQQTENATKADILILNKKDSFAEKTCKAIFFLTGFVAPIDAISYHCSTLHSSRTFQNWQGAAITIRRQRQKSYILIKTMVNQVELKIV